MLKGPAAVVETLEPLQLWIGPKEGGFSVLQTSACGLEAFVEVLGLVLRAPELLVILLSEECLYCFSF